MSGEGRLDAMRCDAMCIGNLQSPPDGNKMATRTLDPQPAAWQAEYEARLRDGRARVHVTVSPLCLLVIIRGVQIPEFASEAELRARLPTFDDFVYQQSTTWGPFLSGDYVRVGPATNPHAVRSLPGSLLGRRVRFRLAYDFRWGPAMLGSVVRCRHDCVLFDASRDMIMQGLAPRLRLRLHAFFMGRRHGPVSRLPVDVLALIAAQVPLV